MTPNIQDQAISQASQIGKKNTFIFLKTFFYMFVLFYLVGLAGSFFAIYNIFFIPERSDYYTNNFVLSHVPLVWYAALLSFACTLLAVWKTIVPGSRRAYVKKVFSFISYVFLMGLAFLVFLGGSFSAGFSPGYQFELNGMFSMLATVFPISIGVFLYYRKERFLFTKSLLVVPILLPIISIGYTVSSPSRFTAKDCHAHRDEYSCYEYLLEKSQNASICEGIDPNPASDAEEKCYATAVKQGLAGKDACEKVGWLKAECVENYVRRTKDWSACKDLDASWCFGWEVKQQKLDGHWQSSDFSGREYMMDEYIATNTLTVDACKAFQWESDARIFESCIIKFAFKEKDLSLCERPNLENKKTVSAFNEGRCLSVVAPYVSKISKDYCRNLSSEKRPFCYAAIFYQSASSIYQRNNAVCTNIGQNESYTKADCFASLAGSGPIGKSFICQNIPDAELKEYCFCMMDSESTSCLYDGTTISKSSL